MLRISFSLLCLLVLCACGPVAQPTPLEPANVPSPAAIALPTTATAVIPVAPQPEPATIPISTQPSPQATAPAALPAALPRPAAPVPACLPAAAAPDAGGSAVTEIAAGAGRAFAAAYSPALTRTVVYASDDKGLTWTPVRTFNDFISSVVLSPDFARDRTVFAAGLAGVYRSLNAGGTWNVITPGTSAWITTTLSIKQIVVSPNYSTDHTLIFASRLAPRGVFASTDGGATWVDWLVDAADNVLFSPDYAIDQALWVVRNDERTFRRDVLVTVNQGNQWDAVRTGTLIPLALSPAYAQDGTVLWTDLASGGIFVSRNADRLFPEIEQTNRAASDGSDLPPAVGAAAGGDSPLRDLAFSPDFGRDRTVFAVSGQGVLASQDGGAAWRTLCSGTAAAPKPGRAPFSHLAISPDFASDQTLYAAGNESRVLVSRDGGRTWAAAALK